MNKLLIILLTLLFCAESYSQNFYGDIIFEENGTNNDIITLSNNYYTRIGAYTYSNNPSAIPLFVGFRARGNENSPSNLLSDDRVSGFFGAAFLNGTYVLSSSMEFFSGQNTTSNSTPSYMIFGTTPIGSTQRQERVRINEDGNMGIGTPDPKSKLQVSDGDIYISDISKGVIMTSSNGNCWRLTIDNSGSTVVNSVICP